MRIRREGGNGGLLLLLLLTCPRAESDLLIVFASSSCFPSDPDFLT
jgi:hypothetical protein